MKRGLAYLIKKGKAFVVRHPSLIPHYNGNRLNNITTLKTVGLYVFVLLWLLKTIEIGKSYICNNFTISKGIDACFVVVEEFLTDDWWLNVLTTITCLWILLIWLKHVWDDRYLSLKRMLIAICGMSILSFLGTLTNIHTPFKIDYVALSWYVLFVQILLDFIKLWYGRWNVKAPGKSKLKYTSVH